MPAKGSFHQYVTMCLVGVPGYFDNASVCTLSCYRGQESYSIVPTYIRLLHPCSPSSVVPLNTCCTECVLMGVCRLCSAVRTDVGICLVSSLVECCKEGENIGEPSRIGQSIIQGTTHT